MVGSASGLGQSQGQQRLDSLLQYAIVAGKVSPLVTNLRKSCGSVHCQGMHMAGMMWVCVQL